MITARDVAEKLGLSISTVGRAMSDDPRISADTKKKVRRAADEIGYVGNLPARMMRGGSSKMIGLILPDVQNDFFASIAQALSACCDRQGFRLVLSITGDDKDAELRHIRDLAGARVAGIIIVPTARPRKESASLLEALPHVQLLRHVASLGDTWFGIDDDTALESATSHLLRQGHRSIAYVGGSDALSTGAARAKGVRRAFERAGADDAGLTLILGETTAQAGEAAIRDLLGRPKPPTAIMSGSVHVSLGILAGLKERGVSVPKDISVIGFGDPIWFAWWGPGLTTVRPPTESLATTCCLWFLEQLRTLATDGEKLAHQAISQSSFIVRGSTAPLKAPSKRVLQAADA
jgi:LacI family transcriptional regulator